MDKHSFRTLLAVRDVSAERGGRGGAAAGLRVASVAAHVAATKPETSL